MAVSTGYTTGIRQALNDKGISSDRISYNPSSGVTIDGNSFYQPERVYNGTSFTSPTNFSNAWNNYSKTQNQNNQSNAYGSAAQNISQYSQQPTQTTQHQTSQDNYNPYASSNTVNNNPYTSQTDQIIKQLLEYNKNQQAFDPYSTSAYQAAQAQAQRAAQQNTRAAQESYGSAGFGRSTALGERVAGINNDATEYLMTQVLPQIEAQEQARKQQEFNNIMAALNPLMNQQSRADNLVQQDFNNRITEGQLTGNYINPEASAIIDQLLNLKTDTEANWRTLTPEQRAAATQQADVYRNQISAMGYDPTRFGADVSASNASQNRGVAGRTLAGQQLDYQQQADTRDFNEGVRQYDQNFAYQQERDRIADEQWQQNYGVTLAQITGYMPDGTPTSAQQQQLLNNLWMVADQTGAIPKELADMYGLKAGTPTRAAKEFAAQLAIQQQNANTSAYSARASASNAAANTALSRERFNYEKEQDAKNNKATQYNYKTDPQFAVSIKELNSDPVGALRELQENPDMFIGAYGYDGYSELLKQAESKNKATSKSQANPFLPDYLQR